MSIAIFRLNYAWCSCTDDIATLTLLKRCIDVCYCTRNMRRPRYFRLFSYFSKITRLFCAIFRCRIHRLQLSIAAKEIYSLVTMVSGLALYIGRSGPISVSNYFKITPKADKQAGKMRKNFPVDIDIPCWYWLNGDPKWDFGIPIVINIHWVYNNTLGFLAWFEPPLTLATK